MGIPARPRLMAGRMPNAAVLQRFVPQRGCCTPALMQATTLCTPARNWLRNKLALPHKKMPMLAGLELENVPNDDIQFVIDLGLCKIDPLGGLVIANPIYREVLPRVLTVTSMASLPQIVPTWLTQSGELDVDALLHAFIEFWRQHGEPLLGTTSFHEIAPHIVLMAFLHRVVNGGGTLEREYAIGRDKRSLTPRAYRMDLCLRYKNVTLGIELKAWRDKTKDPEEQGLDQLDSYLERIKVDYGWLFVFDRRKNAPPFVERLLTKTATTKNGRSVVIIRA
jgi:hypothetical protein